jgi:hypothetical protein
MQGTPESNCFEVESCRGNDRVGAAVAWLWVMLVFL